MSIFRSDGALDVRFDLFYDQRWNEIPNEDTRGALAQAGGLEIRRGLPNESGEAPPTSCNLAVNNRDGKYSPRNPFSPLFGKLGRNTQLRARVVGEQFETAPTAKVKSLTTDTLIGNVNNVDAPPGLAEGDVLIAFVTHPGSQTFDQQAHPQGGALWFEIAEVQSFDPSVQPFVAVGRTKVYWKVAGPDEPAQYQFNFDSGPDGIITIVAVQNASHARPQLIAATEPEFSTSMTSVSSLPGAPSLELRWVAGHGNFLSAPTATWSAPEGFVQEALFDDIDTNAILTSRLLSTLGETGDHVFTVDEPVAFKTAVTVNVLSQDTTPIRATVEVPAWPARWDPSSVNQPVDEGAGDVWVPIEGAGILRRLGQGAKPLRSPMYRVHMGQADAGFGSANQAHLVAYWPLEEGENAEIGVSPLENVPNARFSGNLNLGDAAPSPGTENLVSVEDTTGRIRMDVPSFPDDWTIFQRWMTGFEFAHDPDAGSGDNVMSFRFVEQHFRWEVTAEVNASGGLDWEITRADLDDDSPVPATQDTGTGDSAPFYWVEMRKASNAFQVVVNGVQVLSGVVSTADQIGPPTSLEFRILSGADPVLYGHVGVWAIGGGINFDNSLPDFLSAIDGYRGERAGRRIQRLCAEEGIPFYAVGNLDDTPFMGPQPITEFLDALRDAENVDIGFLYEPRDQLGISYRTRSSLYGTVPDLVLTFGARGEVVQPLEPMDDDQQTTNDVTASRPGGSSARAVQTTGPLSTQDPPNGVGLYDTAVTVNVLSDLDLAGQAEFRLALGTVDEARYPVITLDLLALYEYDKFDLFKRAAELDVGSRMQVQDPPQWLPPDVIDQFAIGFSETITEFSWEISTNNRPASPFIEIAEFADEEETPAPDAPGRYDTAGTRSAETFEIGVDTKLLQETTVGQLWTVNNGGVLLRGTPGEAVATQDHPSLDITGDIDVRFDGTLRNWGATPDNQTLVSKYDPTTNNRSWWLLITAAGQLRFQWSEDGTTVLNQTADAVIPAGPNERLAVRATMDVDNGSGGHTVRFYTAATLAGPWVQLGSAQSGSPTTSIFSGSAEVRVGSLDGGGARTAGYMHAAEVRSGIDEDAGLQLDSTTPSYASTPDSAQLDVLSSIDVRVDVKLNDWASGSEQTLLSKFDPTGDQCSYLFQLSATGQLEFFWSEDGTLAGQLGVFTDLVIPPDTERIGLRFTMNVRFNSLEIQFWTAPTIAGPWTPFDSPLNVPGFTTSIFNSNAELRVGLRNDDVNPAGGVVYAAEVRNGVNGTVVANPVFEDQAPSTASFNDGAGNTWTMNGGAVIIASQTSTVVANPDFTQRGSDLNVTDDQGRLWTLGTGVLVNGDLPLDIRMDSIQLRVRDIHYEWPTLVNVQVEASGTTSSFSVPAPTGLQKGDLLVAFYANDAGAIRDISGGSVWTEIAQFDSLDGSGGLAVFAKIALDNEPSQYDFSQAAGTDGIVALVAIRNARRTVIPIINAGYLVPPSTTLYPTLPTTPIAQSLELRWVCAKVSGSFTPPSGFIEIADVNSGGFIGGALATRRVGSSSLGTGSHTFSGPATSLTNRIVATLNVIGMQTMTVEQQPINAPAGATKLEAPGQPIALWTPTRYAL